MFFTNLVKFLAVNYMVIYFFPYYVFKNLNVPIVSVHRGDLEFIVSKYPLWRPF